MTMPHYVAPFPFPGFGPDMSRGLAVLLDGGRVVLGEAPGNPGTSVSNAIETAIESATRTFELAEDTRLFYWELAETPDGALWELKTERERLEFVSIDPWEDAALAEAVEVLRNAADLS